jgi:hypothetical protein
MPFEVSFSDRRGPFPNDRSGTGTGVRQLLEPLGPSAAEDLSEALIWSVSGREERVQTRGEINVSAKVLSSCRPFQASAWTSELVCDQEEVDEYRSEFCRSAAQAAALRSSI